MNTFDDLFKVLDDIQAARKICEAGVANYEKLKKEINKKLEAITTELQQTSEAHLLNASDTEKEKAILATLEETRDGLYEIQLLRDEMRNFTKTAIEGNITKVTKALLPYEAFRKKMQRELVTSKVEITTAAVRLGTHIRDAQAGLFERSESQKKSVESILAFINEMKQLNFYDLKSPQKERLIQSLKTATEHYVLGVGNTAKRGMYNDYIDKLKNLLERGIEFSEYSEKCWAACELRKKQLVDDNYIKQMQEEIGMLAFDEGYALKRGTIGRQVKHLEANLLAFGSEASQEQVQRIRANKIPPQIQWLKKAYDLGKWTYENLGEQIGGVIGLPQEAPFKFEKKTPDAEAAIDIPVASLYGVADIGFEFGASVEAALSFDGKLTLTNFLDASEDDYVTGEINASAKASAEAFVGIFAKLVQLIKASGRIVASAEAALAAKGEAKLSKANIENIALFKIGSSAGISFTLEGHLEAALGLTPVLSTLIKQVTGKKPEVKLKSPSLDMFKAERKATVDFEMPLREKPYDLPRDSLKLSSGEWEVSFIAKDTLTEFWRGKIGGADEWKRVTKGTKVHEEDLRIIREEFATLGQQAV